MLRGLPLKVEGSTTGVPSVGAVEDMDAVLPGSFSVEPCVALPCGVPREAAVEAVLVVDRAVEPCGTVALLNFLAAASAQLAKLNWVMHRA